jgi:PKD repeat protein
MKYEWSFSDGTKAIGTGVSHVFGQSGRYRPTLKVTDAKGNVDYDFGKVTVADPDVPPLQRCYLHASYWPTKDIHVGDEVAFLVRSFRFVPPQGDEIWDFGDGSPPAHSRSDGTVDHHSKNGYDTVTHCFKEAGHYVVTVRRNNNDGQWAVDKIDVRVE